MTWTELPPGLVLIAAGLLALVLPLRLRQLAMLALPVLGLAQLVVMPEGTYATMEFFGVTLIGARVDGLSLIWGYVFYIAAFIGVIFQLHIRDRVQDVAAMIYAGAAIGAVFAGDLVTLFVYWELTAIASAFLIFATGTAASYRAGMRYLIVQIASGVLLLGGIVAQWQATGTAAFEAMTLQSPGAVMIFLGFGIKCAFPLLHNWLPDAYPQGTPTGTVFLSAFTTKMAVYVLARGFPGTEELIWIGAAMATFTVFYALIENDLRRVVAYSLNTQLGFMVVGVGIGTEMALNGAAAHAFTGILYKGLLFMALGAVIHRVGTAKASELGGLAKAMPVTALLCVVGAVSISAFPLFAGYVSKSLIFTAVSGEGRWLVWGLLLFASVAVFVNTGIRLPYRAFYGPAQGTTPKPASGEAPVNMLLAMGIAAIFCVALGVMPGLFFDLLPFPTDYSPYAVSKVVTQLQLLAFTGLAVTWMMRRGMIKSPTAATNLEFDWVYRVMLKTIWRLVVHAGGETSTAMKGGGLAWVGLVINTSRRLAGPMGPLARSVMTGTAVLWLTAMLGLYLLVFYI